MANEKLMDTEARQKEMLLRVKRSRNAFDLHVLLIMDQEKITKPNAIVLAYLEGYEGKAIRTHENPVK